MSRIQQNPSAPSPSGATIKQTRSSTSSRNSHKSLEGNHDTLRNSDVSHQQPPKLRRSSTAQKATRRNDVGGPDNSGHVSAAAGGDDSAEEDGEDDDSELISIAPPADSSDAEDQRAGLDKDVAITRSAAKCTKHNLKKSSHFVKSKEINGTNQDMHRNARLSNKKGTKRGIAVEDRSGVKRRTAAGGPRNDANIKAVEGTENSDEDDYNGVDLISNSEGEEPEVEQLEEKMIIDSEEENEATVQSPILSMGPPSISSGGWDGFDLDDGVFLSDVPFFDEQISRYDPNLIDEIAIYNAAASFEGPDSQDIEIDLDAVTSATTRRVRFEEEVRQYSDSASTTGSDDEDEDGFPDLFMHQDSLDPSFRLMIENDNDEDDGNSLTDGEGSYWDLRDREDFELEKHGLDGNDGSSSCGSSSGYESGCSELLTMFYIVIILTLLSLQS